MTGAPGEQGGDEGAKASARLCSLGVWGVCPPRIMQSYVKSPPTEVQWVLRAQVRAWHPLPQSAWHMWALSSLSMVTLFPRYLPVKMPILKSLGVADPKVPRAGTLPLRSSRNPFEEIPGLEEEAGELGTLPNGTSCHRRATLEKLAGLSPFRLGWAQGRRAGSPGDGPPRSFLGRVLPPGLRRSSADFGLLSRLQGTRAHGDEEGTGEAARRLAFLRLGRGPKPRRASLAERVVPAGEAAPEPPPKVPEPPKMKEPLSGEWGSPNP